MSAGDNHSNDGAAARPSDATPTSTKTLVLNPPPIEPPSSEDGQVNGPLEATEQDLEQLWQWNQTVPPLIQICMHDIVSARAKESPDTIAIQSWDGTLTYREVEDLSTKLAQHLHSIGIVLGSRVPLCFEKSMWAAVALLGVMKAGATFSMTDPSQPEARLRTIVEQTGAELVITSAAQRDLGLSISLNGQVLAVAQSFFDKLQIEDAQPLPPVPSSTPMYIIFTSGSTGKPKGVVISHENYTSGALPRAEAVGYKAHSKVFDFPSYAFDVSIDCMICTLAVGGRVCVPSEEARMNDLSGAIRDSKANMVHMTPSVARVLDTDIIPSLEVLGLGGEAVGASDAAAWSENTSLIIAYGPSECTVGCTINNTVTVSTGIGKGVGGVTWIVDPDDHNRLMPVGAVGELIIEGPVVGVGYLDEPEKTAQVFVEDPTWLMSGHKSIPGRHGRLYKTGDLVRYESNGTGSIEFVGRKDQQVKLRGQRVELAEVEHHLRMSLPTGVKVAAEVIKPEDGSPTLVAFLSEPNAVAIIGTDGLLTEPSPELSAAIATLDTTMGTRVPRYMVPAAFIALVDMPSLVSRKIDRKKLREIGLSIPREKLGQLQSGEEQEQEPETRTEKLLQKAWKKVLNTDANIHRQSSFFSLGGDSLRGMKLVAAAREEGVSITVADIFTSPLLSDMARKAKLATTTLQEDVRAFSLLEDGWGPEAARSETAALCDIEVGAVEDVYPCTPLQEALMALSAKVKEAYVAQRVVELQDLATAERLVHAFEVAEKDCPILRTRIVQVPGRGLAQVVVNTRLVCASATSLDEYLRSDRDQAMELGQPLVRYAIVNDQSNGKVSFVLTMHHALYDGWAMPLVVERVNKAYKTNEKLTRPADFKHFIKYLKDMKREESAAYWREQLQGANGPQFPSLPWKGYQTQADSLWEAYVPLKPSTTTNVTVATVIRAAYALVASQYTNSTDVVFGETLTGRNAPIVGAEEIEGPMITTVPVRIQIDLTVPIVEYLQDIQEQTVGQIQHEHFGLQHIRRLSPDALEACELRTGLVLHPSTETQPADGNDLPANRLVPAGDAEAAQEALKFNTYALMLVCSIDPKGFLIMASFDSNAIDMPTAQRMLEQLKQTCQMLWEKGNGRLEDIPSLTPGDVEQLRGLIDTSKSDEMLVLYPKAEAAYVVSTQDVNRLVPIGGVGEVLIQTAAELDLPQVITPLWLKDIQNGEEAKSSEGQHFYKTGKLAKYGPEGRLVPVEAEHARADASHSAPVKRVSATSRRQRKLRSLWSRVLKVAEEDIGLNDSFFLRGGDSIAAMKLVSEGRLEGVKLTVAQIFQKRSLYDMANAMEETDDSSAQVAEDVAPFSLLDTADATAFVEEAIRPQLADPTWNIVNVLPARPLQQVAVKGTTQMPRFSARYELMYFDGAVDRQRLQSSCRELVARNEILRTVFVEQAGRCYGVVLEQLPAAFVEYDTDSDVEAFAKQLCRLDVLTRMPLGSCFVKWFLVAGCDGRSCLVFRISHAQYDEMCLPLLLRQFSCLYEDKPVQATVPFSSYVGHVVRRNIPESIAYWKDLLAGSAMTSLKPDIPAEKTNHFAIEKTIDISSRSRDMTVATLPTAAWALCLAKHLSLRDVTFGEVVSGRNIDFPSADAVIGPCWQYVPVRVAFDAAWTVADLLAHVQHQHVASAAHEGAGLAEIRDSCTDWPAAVDWFDTVVHQDVDHVESLDFLAASSRMETLYPHEEPLREWKMQAFIKGEQLTLEIVTIESWSGYAEKLLEELAEVTRFLVRNPQAKLFA